MEKNEKFQIVLTELLHFYAKRWNEGAHVVPKYEVIIDKENKHFQLVSVGWKDNRFVYSIPFYFEIKNGKIWIQVNNTDILIAEEIVDRGIQKSDIVLGFHPEHRRPATGFAVA